MVSRCLWLNLIEKESKSVGSPVNEGNLWSPFNQFNTWVSALILELDVKWFEYH